MSISRPVFGRKGTAPSAQPVGRYGLPPHPGPDPDGVSRVIPREVFEGEHGAMLRELGFDADDARNMMWTPELNRAREEAAIAQQRAFVAKVESQLPPGCKLAPYAMLPWEMWKRKHGKLFAFTCQYYPAQPWNTMLLAGDERTSMVLDLPEHPGAYPEGLMECAEGMLDEVAEEHEAVMVRTGASLAAGKVDMQEFAANVEDIKARIPMLANAIAELALGEDVYWRHLQMFGKALGWNFAPGVLARGRPEGPLWR